MSRSWWYGAGAAGFITLTRVRLPGKKHGRVLLPVAQALALVENYVSELKIDVNRFAQDDFGDRWLAIGAWAISVSPST